MNQTSTAKKPNNALIKAKTKENNSPNLIGIVYLDLKNFSSKAKQKVK